MKKLTIAIDVDGVLRMNLETIVDLYNRNFNKNMTVDELKNYDVSVTFPEIERQTGVSASQWLFQDHSHEIFRDAPAYDRASSGIELLRNISDVVIITYQKSFTNKIDTIEFLEKNSIGYDGLYFTKDKSMLKCDWLVDDNPDNFIGCNAEYGALISAPYNMDVDLVELKKKSGCKDLVRFSNFSDFVDSIIGWICIYGETIDGSKFFASRCENEEEAAKLCRNLNALRGHSENGTKYYVVDRTFCFS